MACFRWLVAVLACRRPGICTRVVDVGFVANKATLGQILFLRPSDFAAHCYYNKVPHSLGNGVDQLEVAVPRYWSLTPHPFPLLQLEILKPLAYKGSLFISLSTHYFVYISLSFVCVSNDINIFYACIKPCFLSLWFHFTVSVRFIYNTLSDKVWAIDESRYYPECSWREGEKSWETSV
jgi:hypothetical protein